MIWWNYCYAPTIQKFSFNQVKSRGTLTVPTGAEGYEEWMKDESGYLGYTFWTIQYSDDL